MLCKLGTTNDLKRSDYYFEPKLDGTRAIAYIEKNMRFINRRNIDITSRYPEFRFRHAISKRCVLDGEIIVYNEKGIPDFNLLQMREQLTKQYLIKLRAEEIPATYVVFDILEIEGKALIDKPLSTRKQILSKNVKPAQNLEIIFWTEKGTALWRKMKKLGMEGVVAKRRSSRYIQGSRTDAWIKIKNLKTIDCVIIGFTQERRKISSLALACYHKGTLRYIGNVGTGFTEEFISSLYKKLLRLQTKSPPVRYPGKKKIIWLKPKLVAEVRFLELTKDRILRAPSFLRLRYDKNPEDCILEEQITF